MGEPLTSLLSSSNLAFRKAVSFVRLERLAGIVMEISKLNSIS